MSSIPETPAAAIEAYDVHDLSRAWKVSALYVRGLVQSGALPHFRLGTRLLVSRAAAEQFIRERETRTWEAAPSRSVRAAVEKVADAMAGAQAALKPSLDAMRDTLAPLALLVDAIEGPS
jgi:hypothetical protein